MRPENLWNHEGKFCCSPRGTQRRILHGRSRSNREWIHLGSVVHKLSPSDHVRPLALMQPEAIIVEDARSFRALRSAGVDAERWILLSGEAEGATTFDQMREVGRQAMAADPGLFARINAEVTPDTPAILYMTSGATGEPKMGLVTQWAVGPTSTWARKYCH